MAGLDTGSDWTKNRLLVSDSVAAYVLARLRLYIFRLLRVLPRRTSRNLFYALTALLSRKRMYLVVNVTSSIVTSAWHFYRALIVKHIRLFVVKLPSPLTP